VKDEVREHTSSMIARSPRWSSVITREEVI
jgi:hypothetical protein